MGKGIWRKGSWERCKGEMIRGMGKTNWERERERGECEEGKIEEKWREEWERGKAKGRKGRGK
jgi:hypothetical protein